MHFPLRLAAFLVFVWLLLPANITSAAIPPPPTELKRITVYLATTGDDKNPGTLEQPLATFAKAQQVVCEQMREKPLGFARLDFDVTVVVRGGTYRLTAPLEFTPTSFTDALRKQIRFSSHPGETVVLSGGEEIRGWKAVGDVWQTEVPDVKSGKWKFIDLYVGDERRPRARTPNEGYFRIEKAGDDRRTSFSFRPGEVKAWANPSEAEVVFLHDWSTSHIRVKQIDEAARKLEFTNPIGANAPHYAIDAFEPHPRYLLEGAREFRDAPGEWHLDAATGVLTYRPKPGEALEGFVALAPRLANLLTIRGEEKAKVGQLTISGFTFAHTAWLPPEQGFAGYQACFFESRDDVGKGTRQNTAAAVKVDLAQVNIDNCRFEHLGGAGIWLERACRQSFVQNCRFDDIAANGIMVGEITSLHDGWETSQVVLSHNEVRRCGQRYFGAVGIWLGLVNHCTVEFCDVYDLPYTGISVGWNWSEVPTSCHDNIIRHNAIHNCMLTLSDGGGIYTLGRQPGTVITGNRIYDIPANAGRAESNGMFLDEGSSEFEVTKNTIYQTDKSPIRFHKAARLTLRGNKLVTTQGVPTFRYNSTDPAALKFEDNEEIDAARFTPPKDPTSNVGPNRKN